MQATNFYKIKLRIKLRSLTLNLWYIVHFFKIRQKLIVIIKYFQNLNTFDLKLLISFLVNNYTKIFLFG